MDLKSCRVLVTPTSYAARDKRLRADLEAKVGEVIYNTTGKPLNAQLLKELLPGVDGYIAGLDEINRVALEAADRLKVVARYGVGVDNVDREYCMERNIIVTNTPGANASSVAELAVGLMLSLARSIPQAYVETRLGKWPRFNGFTLEGCTVGLLGLGAIGKIVARILVGFGSYVLAYDPYANAGYASDHGIKLVTLQELIHQSDIISIHAPLTPQTNGLVNTAFLEQMKEKACIVNTARGEIIDERALYQALSNGHLAGAALDVFSKEPPEADNPLLSLPQVIVTPHIASHTDSATNTMGWMALNDCLAVLSGKTPEHPVI
jgi:D-3-phosphoglycerate dehydrogenase